MKQALIVFVRHPELGKVKTRLAATLGNDAALSIYKKLLQHTFLITDKIMMDKFIFYSDEIVKEDLWQRPGYFKARQTDGDLGDRMRQAFEYVFTTGYDRVCIIGSDCYDLSATIIDEAFLSLNITDIVVGPATDGGYYLLGMKEMHIEIFNLEQWSTGRVFEQTLELMKTSHLSYTVLQTLTDVDEEKDVPGGW
ncbi:MAG: TIGR04282 family arsenosugar biosynthesis glycosyltransferase [Ginsengibacter sp.]